MNTNPNKLKFQLLILLSIISLFFVENFFELIFVSFNMFIVGILSLRSIYEEFRVGKAIKKYSIPLLLRDLEVKLTYAKQAYSRIFIAYINDEIIYKKKYYFVKSKNHNGLIDIRSLDDMDQIFCYDVNITILRSIKRDYRIFKDYYKFKMNSWYLIDVCHGKFRDPISGIF